MRAQRTDPQNKSKFKNPSRIQISQICVPKLQLVSPSTNTLVNLVAKYSCIRCVVASSISHNIRILHTSCFRTQISKPRLFVLQLQSHKSPTVYGLTHSMSHVLQPDTPIKKLLLVRSDIDSVPLVGLPPDQVEEPAAQSPAHEEKHIYLSQITRIS